MARVFVSYRHVDSRGHAGRLYDGLTRTFGSENVYRDVDNSAPGARIDERIRSELANCDAFVAVVGPRWAADGESDNWMRREIALALEMDIRIFLALVDDLRPRDLPAALAALAEAEAIELSDSRWDYDVGRLTDAIGKALAEEELAPNAMAVARSLAEGRLVVVLGSSGLFGGSAFSLLHLGDRSLHSVLAALPGTLRRKGYEVPLRLVTTENGDGLESALRDAGEQYRLADAEHSVFEWAFKEPFVPAPRTIVVKLEAPPPSFALTPPSTLETLLTRRPGDFPLELTVWMTDENDFLFLGGSEHDEAVARIVKRRQERSHRRAWVAGVSSIQAQFWETHGVEVVAAELPAYGRALTRQVEALPPLDVAAAG